MVHDGIMRISDVAEAAGCSVRAIRHYHACGAVPEPARSSNGYRNYGVGDLTAVLRVRSLVSAGISLHEIKSTPKAELYGRARKRIDTQIEELQAQRERLHFLQHDVGAMPADLPDKLRELLGDNASTTAEIEAWELMAFTGVATTNTWLQLRSNLNNPEHRDESWQLKKLWIQLGKTAPQHAEKLIEEWVRLKDQGIMTGVIDTLQPGSVNLIPTDIPTLGAQLLAIEASVRR